MPAPALILFDLDEVLVRYDRAARVQHLAMVTGVAAAAVRAALFDSGLERESDLGRWQSEPYAAELARRLGTPVSLADCVRARAAAVSLDAGVYARARRLARRSRCAILTNNGWFLREHLPAMCPPLFPLFSGQVYCSAEYGIAKPEPEVFLRCLHSLAVPARSTLFIDDNIDNVQGAVAAGLDAIHFTALPALDRALAERGLPEESDDAT